MAWSGPRDAGQAGSQGLGRTVPAGAPVGRGVCLHHSWGGDLAAVCGRVRAPGAGSGRAHCLGGGAEALSPAPRRPALAVVCRAWPVRQCAAFHPDRHRPADRAVGRGRHSDGHDAAGHYHGGALRVARRADQCLERGWLPDRVFRNRAADGTVRAGGHAGDRFSGADADFRGHTGLRHQRHPAPQC